MTPRFSIIIPTRNRAVTLPFAVRSVARQAGEDVEIIVSDNASTPATHDALQEFGDTITRVRWDTPLSMQEHWRRILPLARGEWVMVIGDDDALLPDCLQIARTMDQKAEVIMWPIGKYYWPGAIAHEHRMRWTHPIPPGWVNGRAWLNTVYRFRMMTGLPGVYHRLVRRSLIERITETVGTYPLSASPDIGSGLVSLGFARHIFQCDFPLTLAGYSKSSTGENSRAHGWNTPITREFKSLDPDIAQMHRDHPLDGDDSGEAFVMRLLLWARPYLLKGGINVIEPDESTFRSWQRMKTDMDRNRLRWIDLTVTDVRDADAAARHLASWRAVLSGARAA